MKNSVVVLGVFILAGIVFGAFVIALYGREKPQDLNSIGDRTDNHAAKIATLEQGVRDLNGKLESNLALIRENERSIREFKGQLPGFPVTAGQAYGDTPAAAHDQHLFKVGNGRNDLCHRFQFACYHFLALPSVRERPDTKWAPATDASPSAVATTISVNLIVSSLSIHCNAPTRTDPPKVVGGSARER